MFGVWREHAHTCLRTTHSVKRYMIRSVKSDRTMRHIRMRKVTAMAVELHCCHPARLPRYAIETRHEKIHVIWQAFR